MAETGMYAASGHEAFGSIWYAGRGAKGRMQQHAATTGASVQLQITEPDSGDRGYICFKDWETARTQLAPFRRHVQHFHEIIQHGKPCKPYLDIDGRPEELPEGLRTVPEVIERTQRAVQQVFEEDYGHRLQPTDFVWLHSDNQTKLSLHLVVSTKEPQLVYRSNHRMDAQGAYHLAARVHELDGELGRLVDKNVYTKDREMRMCGSSKYDKKQSVLKPVRDTVFDDSVITWVQPEERRKTIQVPCCVPPAAVRARRDARVYDVIPAPTEEGDAEFVEHRVLELLRERLHPSAYRTRAGQEDAFDAALGIRFNYSDRSEACYTGKYHPGKQNLKCWVDAYGIVHARCFSASCSATSVALGPLHAEPDEYASGAVRIDCQYLQRKRMPPAFCVDSPLVRFNHVVDRWLDGEFKVLSIKSPMGTGKTTFLETVIRGAFQGKRILAVTYRQSLAYNLASKLPGFHNYLDGGNLADRAQYPCVICQLDSIHKLAEDEQELPAFDVVILDEVESLLNHFSAATLYLPNAVMELLLHVLEGAEHVVTMDALWGAQTSQFLQLCDMSNQLVINEYRSPPRTFAFGDCKETWMRELVRDVEQGANIVVVSLSSEQLHRVHAALAQVLGEDDIILHTSKTSDELKKELQDVNGLWMTRRAVLYSPTIESGVDCTLEHFDRMYVYACLGSTTPLGLYQMTGRVRKLKDPVVRVCVQSGIRLQPATGAKGTPRVSVHDQLQYLRWVDRSVRSTMPHARVRGPGGKHYVLPAVTPLLLVSAHNEARRLNGSARFFQEFRSIAEEQGHRVTIERPADANAATGTETAAPNKDIGTQARALLSYADLTEEEYEAVQKRIYENEASSDDKWLAYKHMYKKAWGIDRITPEFVDAHGTGTRNGRVHLCMQLLYPSLRPTNIEAPREAQTLLKVGLITQVMDALGWEHPFDYGKPAVSYEDAKERLLSTDCFQKYKQNIRLFETRAKAERPGWTPKDVGDALRTILGAAGVSVASASQQHRGEGGRVRTYAYSIDEEKAKETAALVNLRARGMARDDAELCAGANEVLAGVGYGRWGELVDE